jgi:hypothetical protein
VEPAVEATKKKPVWGAGIERFLYAHALSYPVTFLAALAVIPLSILSLTMSKLLVMSEDQVVHDVLWRVFWPSLVTFVLVHVAAVPWARAKDERRQKRLFFTMLAVLSAVFVLVGGGSWIWLMAR